MDITTRMADEPDFTAKKARQFNQDGHLKLGHLGAGTFYTTSAGIAQYNRLKTSLQQIKGLHLKVYLCHLSNVYLEKKTERSESMTKSVLMQLRTLKALAPKADNFMYEKISSAIESLTGDKLAPQPQITFTNSLSP